MEREVLVFIYKRKKIKADDETESYTYEPSEILHGTEFSQDGNRLFIDDDQKFNYPFIEDIYNLDEKFVYAFPVYLDKLSEGKKEKLIEQIKHDAEDFDKYLLFQIYSVGEDELETFASMDGLETQMSVNTDNYDGFEEMRSTEFSDKIKELKSEIHTVEKELEKRKLSRGE